MTTIACVFVRGHVPFTADYVVKLAAMVKRSIDRPYRFVCLTDRPFLLRHSKGIDCIHIPRPTGKTFGWWSKVRLFDESLGLTGRVLYLDLDTLIVGALGPILDFPSTFALVPHGGQFRTRNGLQVLDRFNSSVMVWDAGVNARLWSNWTPAATTRLWGDQDWISEQMPEADTMPLEWFPRISELHGNPPTPPAKVLLVKKPKNTEAARIYPWFREAWN